MDKEKNPNNNQSESSQTHHLFTYSRKKKHFQVSNPNYNNNSIISDSSLLGLVILTQTFSYDISILPDSLLVEILSRLPLKSIFRFKCVCKNWLELISQPSFHRFYSVTQTAANKSLSWRILYRYIYVSKFKDVVERFRPEIYDCKDFSVLFMSSFEEQQQADQFKVLGVSNGLVLCCLLGPLVYYVCDPVTRQWVTLPRGNDRIPKRHPTYFGEGIVSKVNDNGLLTSYTVVRVEMPKLASRFLNLETFSSETGRWVGYKLPCENPITLLRRGGGPIYYNGSLHWFVIDHGMVAFDPNKEPKSCRLIRFPQDRDVESEYKHEGIYRLCDESQGRLRFFEVAPEADSFYCFSLWDMKDYEKGEWCSESKVTRWDLSSTDPELSSWLMKATFLPLSFHPFNLDIVYMRCVELACVVSYSFRNKMLDVVCKPIGVVEDLSWRVLVPFVIPRWPTPVPIPPVPERVFKPRIPQRRVQGIFQQDLLGLSLLYFTGILFTAAVDSLDEEIIGSFVLHNHIRIVLLPYQSQIVCNCPLFYVGN
uniref:F-box protein At1g49990-like n=1 Tax=Erigeron canadensis TaxID=72917 RepID=UPI001CB96341|nr:F-box protein At1g49990-like [Erigeron canadensis]